MSAEAVHLVLDGHDGAGKTTLAARLAEEVGGVHVRPFGGSLGEQMLGSAERGDFRAAALLARRGIERVLESQPARTLVFDRHWMTLFTLLPESFWSDWLPPPPTTLCWSALDTTRLRLRLRGEAEGSSETHEHYLRRYRDLADRFGCPLLRTDQLSPEESLEHLLAWAEANGAQRIERRPFVSPGRIP
jgi:hypothetical protein